MERMNGRRKVTTEMRRKREMKGREERRGEERK
jgi:hypothetical protein